MSFDDLDDVSKLTRFICLYDDLTHTFIQCLNSFFHKNQEHEILNVLLRVNNHTRCRKLIIFSFARCLVNETSDIAKRASSMIVQICLSSDDILLLLNFIGDGYIKNFINPVNCDGALFLMVVNAEWANRSQRKLCFSKFVRRMLALWYNEAKPVLELAHDLLAVQTRYGWSHVDAIRLAHIKPKTQNVGRVLRFLLKRHVTEEATLDSEDINVFLRAIHEVRSCRDEPRTVLLIRQHNLKLAHVPPFIHNKSKEVWRALLAHNPLDVIFDNFLKIAKLGLFDMESDAVRTLINRLDASGPNDRLKPMQIMKTWKDYELGRSSRGSTWFPHPALLECFSRNFYRSCKNFQRTGKKLLLCMSLMDVVDNKKIANSNNLFFLSAASACALCFLNNEPNCHLFPISIADDLDLDQEIHINQLVQHWNLLVNQCEMCEITPIGWAKMQQIKFDAFLIFTFVPPQVNENFYAELSSYRTQLNQPFAKVIFIYFSQQNIHACSLDGGTVLLNGMKADVPDSIRRLINNNFDR